MVQPVITFTRLPDAKLHEKIGGCALGVRNLEKSRVGDIDEECIHIEVFQARQEILQYGCEFDEDQSRQIIH